MRRRTPSPYRSGRAGRGVKFAPTRPALTGCARLSAGAFLPQLSVGSPPFGCRKLPVMYDESSQARNRKHGATSFGCPGRFMGVLAPKLLTLSSSKVDGMSGVQIGPGATPLTRMPLSASDWASERVNDVMAPFVAL